jgi:glycerol-3-phosphate dehydrogenase
VDVLVIGGGINGCGIARDLAGRGLSVLLCEKDDLASATSSASTKLIHGGLRYLEHFKFGLVRESLKEREVLLRAAPHIIWPLAFVLPHHSDLRPRWLIRLGLFLYDHIGGRKLLDKSRAFRLSGTVAGHPLKPVFANGFSYSDCWVEDARLVVLNALDARERGAEVLTRAECVSLAQKADGSGWLVTLKDSLSDRKSKVEAALVVNATGPWVAETLGLAGEGFGRHKVRHVKGSHIMVPALYRGDHAYILQNDDKRVVFVIPHEGKYSLIGTTDVDYDGPLNDISISAEEVDYLCAAVTRFFRHPVTPEDVEWTYSGVRPLLDDGKGKASAVTREYLLDLEDHGGAPLLSVYGGKLTTYRRLSEQVGDKVTARLRRGGIAWTRDSALPGGEGIANFKAFYKTLKKEYNWLPESVLQRMARAYGTRARDILRGAKKLSDMGEHFGIGIYEAEVRYLVSAEWAMSADDILWRRSRLGLHVDDETAKKLARFLKKMMSDG